MTSGRATSEERSSGLRPYVDFCVQQIRQIVEEIGPRASASPGELRAQQHLAELLEPVADSVKLEPFDVAPKAFMGFIPISGALLLLAAATCSLLPAVALAGALAAIALLVGELVLYRPLIDPLFPTATSHNVVATIRPRGEVKRTLLFGGHCDSAWEWRWHYAGRAVFLTIVGGTLVGALLAPIAAVANLLAPGSGPATTLAWALVVCAPLFLLVMGFTNFRRVSPGANDDLSGVLMSVAIAKILRDRGETPDHTEIRILLTGSEECGLRGARAYANEHHEELSQLPSLYVALDTFRDLDHMAVYDRDRNGMLQHDPAAARLLVDAGRRAGFELPLRALPVGASDAAAFTQAGLPAIALIAMDPTPPRWYHTRLDTPELLEPACIEAGLAVVLELIHSVDSGANEGGLGWSSSNS